jgi:hypothetical protein
MMITSDPLRRGERRELRGRGFVVQVPVGLSEARFECVEDPSDKLVNLDEDA